MVGAMRGGGYFDHDNIKTRKETGAAGVQFIEATPEDAKSLEKMAAGLTETAVAAVEAKGLPGRAYLAALKAARDKHAKDPEPQLPSLPSLPNPL